MAARARDHVVRTRHAGFALPIVLSVLVMLGVMGAAALQASRDELLSAQAVSRSSQAFYAAEAGIHSAIQNWDQPAMDTLVANPGDSLVASWTKIENRCGFQLVYRRVDGGDTDQKLYSLESTGRTPGLVGATRRIGIIVKGAVVGVESSVAFASDLLINGNPKITGLCGEVHANGDLDITGSAIISGEITSAGSVSGTATDTLGNPNTPTGGAPAMTIPDLNSTDYCGDADFVFTSAGLGTKISTSESFDFSGGGKKWGWKWDEEANLYQTDGEQIDDGTYCMDANIGVGTDLGASGDPQVVTFLATGSIMMNGNPYLTPAHPDNIMIIADGDLKLNGNPTGGNDTFEGLIYGGAQCEMNGDPVIHGQLICKNNPDPPGSEDIVAENKINGNMELTFMCGGFFEGAGGVVPIVGRNWSHIW